MTTPERQPQTEEMTLDEHEAEVRPQPTIKVRTAGRSRHRVHETKEQA